MCSCDVFVEGCSIENGGCSHICTTMPGGFECHCRSGFRLGMDLKTCFPIEGNNIDRCVHAMHRINSLSPLSSLLSSSLLSPLSSSLLLSPLLSPLPPASPPVVSNIVLSSLRTQGGVSGHTVFTADLSGTALSRLVDVNNNEDPSTGLIYGMEYDLVDQVLFYADRTNAQIWKVPLQRLIRATDLRQVRRTLYYKTQKVIYSAQLS